MGWNKQLKELNTTSPNSLPSSSKFNTKCYFSFTVVSKSFKTKHEKLVYNFVSHPDLLQTWCTGRHQFLAAFLTSNGLQVTEILEFVCCSHLLQIPPEIFYGVQVRWQPWATSENKPWWTLRFIGLLEGPMTTKSQLSRKCHDVFARIPSCPPRHCRFPVPEVHWSEKF